MRQYKKYNEVLVLHGPALRERFFVRLMRDVGSLLLVPAADSTSIFLSTAFTCFCNQRLQKFYHKLQILHQNRTQVRTIFNILILLVPLSIPSLLLKKEEEESSNVNQAGPEIKKALLEWKKNLQQNHHYCKSPFLTLLV